MSKKSLEEMGLLPEGYQFMPLSLRKKYAYMMGQKIAGMSGKDIRDR